MNEQSVTHLRAFRSILVEERRRIIRTTLEAREQNIAGGRTLPASFGATNGPQIQAIQEQIEAVDRAMADEERAP